MEKPNSLASMKGLLDLLPTLDTTAANIVLLGGSGGGWPARLAFNPSAILSLKDSQASSKKLVEFIKSNQGKLVVGFLSYDFGLRLQELKSSKSDDLKLPDMYFLAYDNYLEEQNGQIKNIGSQIPLKKVLKAEPARLLEKFAPINSKDLYRELFDKIADYIRAGHIYQINLTHRLQAKSSADPKTLFARIARQNQASMMGYLEGTGFELLSMSPERFVKIENNIITTTPIKGTRARTGGDDARQLLSDPKEKSELNMITDLLRNDLAKISEPGSVKIKHHRQTQTLTSLVHTFSTITGKLESNISPIEALLSMFPGGSVTGCPKKRAMEIIEELEPFRRSLYCGSLICIDPLGNLDSSILIRTIIKKRDRLVLPVGGGIVFDSNPDSEYQETLQKAKSIIDSLNP